MTESRAQPDLSNAEVVSPRWVEWRRRIDIDAYDERFDKMAATGANVHGEADFIASLGPATVLDAGCGTGRIAIELARRGLDVTGVDLDADMVAAAARKAPELPWLVDDLARMQLTRRFAVIAMPGNVMLFCDPADRRLIVHNLVQHLEPGGRLVAGFSLEPGYTLAEWDEQCAASGLELADRFSTWSRDPWQASGDYHVSVHRRTTNFTVHDLVFEARSALERIDAASLRDALAAGDAVVVDSRSTADRVAGGTIPGSVHIPRTVLEWRADPASGYTDAALGRLEARVVVVCNDGYSSSLAAANLQRLGYVRATDLIGGFNAWRRAGLPIEAEMPPAT